MGTQHTAQSTEQGKPVWSMTVCLSTRAPQACTYIHMQLTCETHSHTFIHILISTMIYIDTVAHNASKGFRILHHNTNFKLQKIKQLENERNTNETESKKKKVRRERKSIPILSSIWGQTGNQQEAGKPWQPDNQPWQPTQCSHSQSQTGGSARVNLSWVREESKRQTGWLSQLLCAQTFNILYVLNAPCWRPKRHSSWLGDWLNGSIKSAQSLGLVQRCLKGKQHTYFI